jgi:GAF domain-containing protein
MPQDRPALPPYAAFDELSRLVVSEHSLEAVMAAIAEVGKLLLPAANEVSVTLVRDGEIETVASTGPLARQLDERQYVGGTGPCLTAARDRELVSLPDLTPGGRFPEFAAAARACGIRSSLSVPVALPAPMSAGLNLYSDRREGFSEQDVELARTLGAYAAVALANLQLYESQKRVAEHLERALESRGVIDQAKGILMAQHRCSANEAFDLLAELSQRSNRKVRDVAQSMVEATTTG